MRTQFLESRPFFLAAEPPIITVARTSTPRSPKTYRFDSDAGDQEALRQVVAYYHETLKQSPEALRYLESRGLTHPEMIDHFQLGFANRTLGYRLPDKNRKAGAEMRGRLQALGILRESGHEHFNGSIVIPILSLSGDVLGMYGRKITPGLREGTPLHLYLPGPHRGVWNEQAIAESSEVILCEALIDALTFWCAGFRNVTASYGINGFSDEIKAALASKHVYIAYDRDEAGDTAAERLKTELPHSTRVLFPKGMDANEYAVKVTPARQSLAVLLNRAEQPPQATITAAPPEPAIEIKNDEITIEQESRRYRIRGLAKNLSHELMKVNVLVSSADSFHVDTLDLYSARQRAAFTKQASEELRVSEETLKRDLGRVLLKLEELQDEQIRKALSPEKQQPEMTEEDRAAALELLKEPKLLDRILQDFERCGIVGEETNKLVAYLAVVSRHLDSPLAVVVQSSSAAGKSSLMDAVLAFVPEEERVQYSAMTGQSLYYMGEMDLKHKVLAIVEEDGATRASYALKLLQSEGALSIASTGKDPSTGKLVTHQYRVEGPVMIFLTTTAIDLDEELLNRCLVLSVNEDREQTQAIHKLQREHGATTMYVYDAMGQLVAEYGAPTALDSGTKYVTVDHLGSTRLVTDSSANPERCYDYLPFGEEIASVTDGRTSNCFTSAATPLTSKFTGKEREGSEANGLDFFGARYMSAFQDRFTSADKPFVDQHPEDSQSWNLYTYARNNPLRFIDTKGEEATVTSTCTTKDNQTTCQVDIHATVALYLADASPKSTLQVVANQTKSGVEKAWTGTFVDNGVTYNVSTTVDVQTYGSEKAALASGAQNVIGVKSGGVEEADSAGNVAVAEVYARPLGYSGPDRATFGTGAGPAGFAHEFGHLLGVGHHSGNDLMDPVPPVGDLRGVYF